MLEFVWLKREYRLLFAVSPEVTSGKVRSKLGRDCLPSNMSHSAVSIDYYDIETRL